MSETDLPSKRAAEWIVPNYLRADSEIRARFIRAANRTVLVDTYERGSLRLRCPKTDQGCEAVVINTGGGIAGGDRARYGILVGEQASVTVTTQSAEKIYRALGPTARSEACLTLAGQSRVEWIPQETIFFDGAKFERRLDVDMAADASLLVVEAIVFGRLAKGEAVAHGVFRDRWRIRRKSRLVFAEDTYLADNIAATLDRPACGDGARMMASVLHVTPNAENNLAAVRQSLAASAAEWGASAWNGLLLVRILSPMPEAVRAAIVTVLAALGSCVAPRVWQRVWS
jgi:urease accessory protein